MKRILALPLIILMVLAVVLSGCAKSSSSSEPTSDLPVEAVHLGDNLFVITKANEQEKENINTPFVALFENPEEPGEIEVGEVLALKYEVFYASLPPQAPILEWEKISGERETYLAGFNLANILLEHRPGKTYLIDVRSVGEFESGHVPNSINIPVEKIGDITEVIPDKDATILLYCRSGNRSATAANTIQGFGYKVIFDIGGISGYDGELEYGSGK